MLLVRDWANWAAAVGPGCGATDGWDDNCTGPVIAESEGQASPDAYVHDSLPVHAEHRRACRRRAAPVQRQRRQVHGVSAPPDPPPADFAKRLQCLGREYQGGRVAKCVPLD